MQMVLVTRSSPPHSNFLPRAVLHQHPIRTMLRSHIFQATLSLTGLALVTLLASIHGTSANYQDPATADAEDAVEEEDPTAVTGWSLDEKWQPLIGTWTLMNFVHPTEVMESESIRGYLTITEGFLSMIIHARPTLGVNETAFPDHLAQAGLHRWRMGDDDIMQLASVMGHSNFGPELQWEKPNEPREFIVELKKEVLTLTRADYSVLSFRRITSAEFPLAALKRMNEIRGGGD